MTDSTETTPDDTETEVLLGTRPLYLEGAEVSVYVEKLKTRQLFRFLKILTVGAGPMLADLIPDADSEAEDLTQQLLAVLIISIPDAEDEAIDFLKSMVKPTGLIEPEKTKADRQINVDKYTELYAILNNPEPQDTIALMTKIVQLESKNLVALGKQIAALLPSVAKPTTSSKKSSKTSTPAAS